jgi:hypothetical protein
MIRMRVVVWLMLLFGMFLFSVSGLKAEETKKADEAIAAKPAGETNKAEEPKVTGSGSIGFYNKYIFRGYEIGTENFVAQPSLSASCKGFTVTFWGNYDSNQRNSTSAGFSNPGRSGIDEVDLALSYTYAIQKLSLTGGYTYYNLKYAGDTEELFVTLAYDMIGKPAITIFQDINSYPGTYINLAFAHSFALPKDLSLDLGASFGYFAGKGKYWKTYELLTGDYTGSKYKGFHDGMVKAGLTIPVTKAFAIQPVVQYWFPLSSDAKKTYGYNPETGLKVAYNPNGYVKNNFVYGVGFSYSF